MKLDARTPAGPIENRWQQLQDSAALVSPTQRRRHRIIVVGTGLAGASAAATLGELGYQVVAVCYHDSPRRAHSVAAQGGINAAKNYQSDGDSVERLFLDTIRGGDYRSRESNVYRLAQLSLRIIDQSVAQGVPYARVEGGQLANRSFGGTLVSRTFYARGQTGQQLQYACTGALLRQVSLGQVKLMTRHEMLDLVLVSGCARGVVLRNLLTGELQALAGEAVVLATGGYSNVYHLSTNALMSNATAIMRAYRRGAGFANPCFTQIHPTCIPPSGKEQSKLTLMSESLRNDARIWAPLKQGDRRLPSDIPESERDYFLERLYPRYGNLAPRDVASRAAARVCEEGRGVGPLGLGVYLDLGEALRRLGGPTLEARYGNLFQMYTEITGEDPYAQPMRIYPAPHYTMGGLWVDYHLMSNIPGLFVLGEANFSDHGANRLGASALMQGLADGYFISPLTVGDYVASSRQARISSEDSEFRDAVAQVSQRLQRLLAIAGKKPALEFHIELGSILTKACGLSRSRDDLLQAIAAIRNLRQSFSSDLAVLGASQDLNPALEYAARVEDFIDLGELMCLDALNREESCGSHFRTEYQTAQGEGVRDDQRFAHVSVWQWQGESRQPLLHREPLRFEASTPAVRSYA